MSPATVQRIWSARGLKPHRVESFKLSRDPLFEEKLVDVVGLCLNPPEKGKLTDKAIRRGRVTLEAINS